MGLGHVHFPALLYIVLIGHCNLSVIWSVHLFLGLRRSPNYVVSFKLTNEMFSAELQDMGSPAFKSLSRGLEVEVMYISMVFWAKENNFLKGKLLNHGYRQ